MLRIQGFALKVAAQCRCDPLPCPVGGMARRMQKGAPPPATRPHDPPQGDSRLPLPYSAATATA